MVRRLKLPPSPFDSPRSLRKGGADARAAARMAFTHLVELHSDIIQAEGEPGYGPSTVYLEAATRASESLKSEIARVDSYIAAATSEAKRLDDLTAACRLRAGKARTL